MNNKMLVLLLIGVVLLLVVVHLGAKIGYKDGFNDGARSVSIPYTHISYVTESMTCDKEFPTLFMEHNAPIHFANSICNETTVLCEKNYTDPYAWNKWYLHLDGDDWNCLPEERADYFYELTGKIWCRCEFVGDIQ